MRKLLLLTLMVVFGVLFAACGRQGTQEAENYHEPVITAPRERITEMEAVIPPEPVYEPVAIPRPVNAIFLDDLGYMLYVLENNFALFDVAYWARGVNIPAIVENIRAEILADPNMDAMGFMDALWYHFYPLWFIGHFHIMGAYMHGNIVNDPNAWQNWAFNSEVLARLHYPHVMAFYEPMHPTTFGSFSAGGMVMPDNVITEIIEDGRIAYLAVNSFMNFPVPGDEDRQILDFFDEIRDFEHLIIDLRENEGGRLDYFKQLIMGPNIDRNITIYGFVFMPNGRYSSEFSPALFLGTDIQGMGLRIADRAFTPIDEFLSGLYLPDLNVADMERMEYGFRVRTTVSPHRLHLFDNEPAFGGEIWLLTGVLTGSAAQISAWIARETGFATLVGEVTGGNFGGHRTMVALPNSGIVFTMDTMYITDEWGRPLEAGTLPHYFNREGMDALETVLALIKCKNPAK